MDRLWLFQQPDVCATRTRVVSVTRALQIVRLIFPDIDVYRFNIDNASLLDRSFRDTIAICEMEEPDNAADLVVDAMLSRAGQHETVTSDKPLADDVGGQTGTARRAAIGRRIGQLLVLELVLACGPAFRATGVGDVDEVCVTLVHRFLERLDRSGSRVPKRTADRIVASLVDALGEDTTDGIINVLAAFLDGGANEVLVGTAWARVKVWLASGMCRLNRVVKPGHSNSAVSGNERPRGTEFCRGKR